MSYKIKHTGTRGRTFVKVAVKFKVGDIVKLSPNSLTWKASLVPCVLGDPSPIARPPEGAELLVVKFVTPRDLLNLLIPRDLDVLGLCLETSELRRFREVDVESVKHTTVRKQ